MGEINSDDIRARVRRARSTRATSRERVRVCRRAVGRSLWCWDFGATWRVSGARTDDGTRRVKHVLRRNYMINIDSCFFLFSSSSIIA